jgi:hypothetical protein
LLVCLFLFLNYMLSLEGNVQDVSQKVQKIKSTKNKRKRARDDKPE